MKLTKRAFAFLVSLGIAFGTTGNASADQENQPDVAPSAAVQRTPEELQQLVAPIALYPDALVAQILAAATHTAEVVEADRWMQMHSQQEGEALAAEVDQQSWDASVKALIEFPAVLANMDQNVVWTSSLGDAYLSQPQQLMAAIQTMRQRAEAAGYLQSTAQQTVTTDAQSVSIAPADSDVVYVPEYDPWLAYGAPVAVWPGWYPYSGLYINGPGLAFGVGFALGAFGGYGWAWHHWRPDWHRRAVTFDHNPYVWRDRSLIDTNHFFHDHEGFDRPHGTWDNHGFYGGPANAHVPSMPSREFAEPRAVPGASLGRFGGFGHEGFGHGSLGHAEFGGMHHGFGEMGHIGAGIHDGGGHGGAGRR